MIILAFDASTLACSACVLKDGTILASRYLNTGLTHSQTLLPLIESVLSDSKVEIDDVDRIAVTVGPGSFTGIKIAVATAKGLSHKNKILCAPISSLEALAAGIEFQGTICAVEDARRNLLYNANFSKGNRLCEDRQISVSELLQNTSPPILFCGDGSKIALSAAKIVGIEAKEVDPSRIFIRAETVAILGAKLTEDKLLPPEKLEPKYLRIPQAERERMERENQTLKGTETV